jgi:uncharacterized membrane protein
MKTVTSHISKEKINIYTSVKASEIRPEIFNAIKKDHPDFSADSHISLTELNKYRRIYFSSILIKEEKELKALDNEVAEAIKNSAILSENIEEQIDKKLTVGQKISDHIADFGGSWTFIITFFSFILIWIGTNIWLLSAKSFDPYPFILLNLLLSCLAAIQAPIIMMSQNRKEQKDRQRSEHDYKINLKAELEIKLLHEKLDYLIIHQYKRLMEMQQVQADYLDELTNKQAPGTK